MIRRALVSLVFLGVIGAHQTSIASKVRIEGGTFTPFYSVSSDPKPVGISSFFIDKVPVTNSLFYEFTRKYPEWNKGSVPPMYSDSKYLKHWEGAQPPKKLLNAPVVNVSWFAAEAYCEGMGGRLPMVIEWEYVAAASANKKDASRDPVFVQQLLTWYAAPNKSIVETPVAKSTPNAWGVYDMHGLIWEWANDFNSVFVSGDNRREGEELKNMFCGAGSFSAQDKANYAAFMRYALRSSLKGEYTTESLGFRCAYDEKVKNKKGT